MTDNRDVQSAWQYHAGTKHPDGFLLDPAHRFGPGQRPLLFKRYRDVEKIPLPLDISPIGVPALNALANQTGDAHPAEDLSLETLARLLYFSAGVTRRLTYPGVGEIPFRAAACTGALYHIELYVANRALPGLDAGVYHFDPEETALHPLRRGDYRGVLVEAAAGEPSIRRAPLVIIYTDVFWRNAVKYQARAYRHAFWDSGTILANTLAVAALHGLPARLVTGFVDETVNRLLGVEAQREASLALLAVGDDPAAAPGSLPAVDDLDLAVEPYSSEEKQFPAIQMMHKASSLNNVEEVSSWRSASSAVLGAEETSIPQAGWISSNPLPQDEQPQDPLEKVIRRRGSTRRFTGEAITFQELSTILVASTQGIPADFLGSAADRLNQVYLIVNNVEGLASGSYVYHPGPGALEPLRKGQFRDEAGELALGQDLAADASVDIYFLVDLNPVLERFGNRGYRAAQLEASLTAGRIYLASYALHRGATGLTFFDDAVTQFFSPHAQGKSVMFLVAVGVPAKRK